ncbi:MAG: SCO family protein [Alphaproteobacteria bacterium]|nr:SCO family protein [Alphaproteobacteria bacterium]
MRRFSKWPWILLLCAAAAGCGGDEPKFNGIDVTGADWGRDFRLQDPDGRTRSLADFRGKYVMLFFGFTHCPDVCPTALTRAKEVKRLLGADGERLQVIFVTVDPERDTPVLLREYTAAFDPSFLGLRDDTDATKRTAAEFRAFYEKVPTGAGYAVNHSAFTYVFDPQGRLHLAMPHLQSAEPYAADLLVLMKRTS